MRSFSNGKKEKRFNRNWFENKDWKSWLHYNPEKDAAFPTKNANKAFISNGFTNWADAGTKNGGFDKRFKSESRKEAHARLKTIPEACGDIADQMSTAINNERSANRQNLLKILSNVRFLARQALPLRGMEAGKILTLRSCIFSEKRIMKDLKLGELRKRSTNMFIVQFKMK